MSQSNTPGVKFSCKKYIISILMVFFFGFGVIRAQTNISGIINQYAAVLSIDTCTYIITVPSAASFSTNDKILIIQMQGADINESNTASFGTPALNKAGLYETNIISAINGNQITLMYELLNDYQIDGNIQIVSIPQYTDALVVADLLASPWNGSTGGVVALEVSGTLTLNADISADGAGFRGGHSINISPNDCNWLLPSNDYFYDNNNWRGTLKGEGIAAFIPGKEAGRGAQANGGGGGNDHNSGGGGGGNTTAGGIGGRNDEPSNFGCGGNNPGIGGYSLPFSASRIFFGGGGGAGHANNSQGTDGGNGGGIIYLTAQQIMANDHIIRANGSSSDTDSGDGIGGGGGGGTLLVNAAALTGDLTLTTSGGNGGNVNCGNQDRCFGPGGGGSGGRILTNLTGNPGLTLTAQGGQPGVRTNSSNSCNNTTGGAAAGENGVTSNFPFIPQGTVPTIPAGIIQQPIPTIACAGNTASFSIQALGAVLSYQWQFNTGTGFQDITNGAIYSGAQTATLTINNVVTNMNGYLYRCVVSGTDCVGDIFSFPGILTVLTPPVPAFTYMATGTSVAFTNTTTAALSFLWNFGDNTTSTQFSPVHDYGQEGVFDVTLTAWNNCDTTTLTLQITNYQVPQAFISADISTGCIPLFIQYDGFSTGSVSTWQWLFPGGNPLSSTLEDPAVVYSSPGNYDVQLIVANPAGADTVLFTNYVQAGGLPNAGFNYTINGATVSFFNTSAGATSYNWDFGDDFYSTAENPIHTFGGNQSYTVTLLVTNDCGQAEITQELLFAFPPQAYFEASAASGCAPVSVEYNAAATGIDTWQWIFEGGTPATSGLPNPSVVYNTAGVFPVTLIVSNAYGSDTLTQTNSILVQSAPVADFEAIINGFEVYFTNLSQGSVNFQWNFGDNTDSYLIDPSHTYFNPGQYTVTLYAYNDCEADTISQIIQVQIAPVALIISDANQGCAPLTVHFTGWSPDNINFWQWDFPGGSPSSSFAQNPVVTYDTPGSYDVQLVASNGIAATTLTQSGYVVVGTEPTADFTYTVVGNTVYFDNSSAQADSYEWTFDDGSPHSFDFEPVHTYDQGGIYDVTLLALNEYCGSGITVSIPVNYNSVLTPDAGQSPVRLFPNPAYEQVTLAMNQGSVSGSEINIAFFDAQGVTVYTKTLITDLAEGNSTEFQWQLAIGDLPSGIYFCRISTEKGGVFWEKVEVVR